jgi:hypothetical protein
MTKTVAVTQYVTVTIDESKFTPEFLEEFRKDFYPLDSLDDHIEHLAQQTARSVCPETKHWTDAFIEGYGPAKDMGIETSINDDNIKIEIQD